ncbi:MAG: 50S ribosomal protein L30 [Candidatus Ranarchaeia archaeon]
MSKAIIAIRIRGLVNVTHQRENTMSRLHLTRVNHAVIIDDRPEYTGMLQKIKDRVTWGYIDSETLSELLKKRAKVVDANRKPKTENPEFDNKYVSKNTKYKTIDELSEALVKCEIKIKDIPNLKNVFRLTPPSGGFKYSVKRPFRSKGELGSREEKINPLVKSMI